jgi:MFS family permease
MAMPPHPSGQLQRRHWQILWLLGGASFFTGYDAGVVTVALRQVRASYHLSQATASVWIGLLPLGTLPAVALARRADRIGRRRILLVSIVGFTLATCATGLAPNIALAIPVLIFAGSVSDRLGRKPVCCSFLVLSVIGLVCFFMLAHSTAALFGALALTYIGQFGAWPTGTGFGAELFPTALRALGGAAGTVATAVGTSASFVLGEC